MDDPTSGRVRGNRTNTRGEPGLNLRARTAEGEWKFVKKKSKKRKTEGQTTALRDTTSVGLRFRTRPDQELTDSDQKVKAHRTFLEVVLNDAQVPSTRTEQLEDQEKRGGARGKTRSHDQYGRHPRDDGVTQIVVFGVGQSDKNSEITAEQCEVGKRNWLGLLAKKKKAIRTGGKHLQSHGSLDNSESDSPRGKESRRCH